MGYQRRNQSKIYQKGDYFKQVLRVTFWLNASESLSCHFDIPTIRGEDCINTLRRVGGRFEQNFLLLTQVTYTGSDVECEEWTLGCFIFSPFLKSKMPRVR